MGTTYMVTGTPHIRSGDSTDKIMRDVLIALTPAALAGIYFFGLRAAGMMVVCMGFSVLWEWLFETLLHRPVTVRDNSALVTGLLLAMNLPVSAPYWVGIVGSLFAIVVVKQLFGGIGQNFINPALAARAMLVASYAKIMTGSFTAPVSNLFAWGVDTVTTATPLTVLKETGAVPETFEYIAALVGNVGGCIGETSALCLLLGGFYLLYRGVISWRIPVTYLGTVFVLSFVLGRNGLFGGYPLYELLTGGLMLGAFFMATDYSTSPVTEKGQLIMGLGCGLLTVIIRVYGGYPEGVSYSILLMNLTVPLIDRFTRPRVFGHAGKQRKNSGESAGADTQKGRGAHA